MTIRAVIVDDSPLVRDVLRQVLGTAGDIEVVGEAGDGLRAIRLIEELRPDVVTMDVLMPMLDGLEAIRRCMQVRPTPIVVVAADRGDQRALAMAALGAGATEVIAKPSGGYDAAAVVELVQTVRRAASVRLAAPPAAPRPGRPIVSSRREATQILAVVGSTGAPQIIHRIVGGLPVGFPWPMVVVQHTARGFTESFATWLQGATPLRVALARDRTAVTAGEVAVAPDDAHLEVRRGGILALDPGPPVDGHRPSATVLLRSLAAAYGPGAACLVLTGMGRDGAEGAAAIHKAGGLVVVEDPRSAALAGMPGEALQRAPGALQESAPALPRLVRELAGIAS